MPTKTLNPWEAGEQISRTDLHWGAGAIGSPSGFLSFGFRASKPTYTVPDADIKGTFSQFTAAQMAATRSAMSAWADVANFKFSEVNAGGYTDGATILFANYNSTTDGAGAFGLEPGATGPKESAGDVWLNTDSQLTTALPFGSDPYQSLLHEIGHALGLEHPGAYNAGPGVSLSYSDDAEYVEDSLQYSLMSYFSASNTGANHVDPLTGEIVYASTPLLHDIAAIQRLYGANTTTRTGDTVYGFNSNAGEPYAISSSTEQVVYCIWDAGGVDRLDASGYGADQVIDLGEGKFSNIGGLTKNVSIAMGAEIENAYGGSGRDFIFGNGLNNVLNGFGGDDYIAGGDGADVLYGADGNDTLFGGIGWTDTLYGGGGDDFYIVGDIDTIYEAAGAGIDTVIASIRWVLSNALELENLTLSGDANINGFGNSLDNALTGNSGANYLDGGLGFDVLAGGNGDDTYALGDAKLINGSYTWDRVIEGANNGVDTVYASADVGRYTYQLEANVENLVAVGVSIFRLWGNEIGNGLTGNDAANDIAGYGGADTLNGKGGLDTMAGGAGDDTYILDDLTAPNAYGNFVFDTVIELAGEGYDTVKVKSLAEPNKVGTNRYTLGANIENGEITGTLAFNLTGNDLNNTLKGNGAANTLTAGDGNDYLTGFGGADVLIGGAGLDVYFLTDLTKTSAYALASYDTIIEDAAGGVDTVFVTALDNPDTFTTVETYTLGANIENGVIQGSLAFNLNGNDLDNVLAGNSCANILSGGLGDDTYHLTSLSAPNAFSGFVYDTVNEAAGAGIDTVVVTALDDPDTISTVETYTLGANIENGAIAGYLAFNLTGNALSNRMTGNDAANKLTGAAGNDFLDGGLGRDTLTGGVGRDNFEFRTVLSAANVDRIVDFNVTDDTIRIDNAIASGLGATTVILAAAKFYVGAAAHDADDRIIYNDATGALIYDSNGNAAGGATNFAVLSTGLALTNADFLVI